MLSFLTLTFHAVGYTNTLMRWHIDQSVIQKQKLISHERHVSLQILGIVINIARVVFYVLSEFAVIYNNSACAQ